MFHSKLMTGQSIWDKMKQYIREVNESLHVSRLFYLALLMQNLSIGLLAPVITLYAKEVLTSRMRCTACFSSSAAGLP